MGEHKKCIQVTFDKLKNLTLFKRNGFTLKVFNRGNGRSIKLTRLNKIFKLTSTSNDVFFDKKMKKNFILNLQNWGDVWICNRCMGGLMESSGLELSIYTTCHRLQINTTTSKKVILWHIELKIYLWEKSTNLLFILLTATKHTISLILKAPLVTKSATYLMKTKIYLSKSLWKAFF